MVILRVILYASEELISNCLCFIERVLADFFCDIMILYFMFYIDTYL